MGLICEYIKLFSYCAKLKLLLKGQSEDCSFKIYNIKYIARYIV